MRARGVNLGVFYTSKVEQYLFEQKTYDAFGESVRAMPRDDASLMVRVWFDAGKPHPAQRAYFARRSSPSRPMPSSREPRRSRFSTTGTLMNQTAE